jgi:hypothetical protein
MRERLSLGRIVAAGVIAMLAAIGPAQAVSAEPFMAGGELTSIDDGDVNAAGKSGRFIVRNRHVGGTISGSIGGVVFDDEPFTFTFKTNVPIQTQSGNIQGTLTFGEYEAKVIATSELGVTPVPCPADLAEMFGCIETQPGLFFFPGLLINGSVHFTEGAEGTGTVNAFIIPIIDPATGHILGVFKGGLRIQGE